MMKAPTSSRPAVRFAPTGAQRSSVRGFGDDSSDGPTTAQVVIAGAIIGAGLAMAWSAYKGT